MPGQPRAYCGKYLSRWPGFDSWVVQHGRNIRSMQLFSTSGLMASLMLQAHIATGGVLHLPRLKQLSCDFSPRSTVRLLAILPCSLTQLHLAPESRQSEDASGDELLANAIAQLTRLECLQLGRHCCSSTVLLVLRDLTYLTQLKLCDQNTALGDAEFSTLQEVLPRLTNMEVLQVLDVYWSLRTSHQLKGTRGLALGGLTALKQLWLGLEYGFTGEGVVLPAGLTELKLDCSIFEGRIIRQHMTSNPLQYMQLRSLRNLRHLTLKLHIAPLEELPDAVETLTKLKQLNRLDLVYESIDRAHADCKHWPKFPALSCISITEDDGECWRDHQQMQEDILAVMPKLWETLTRLDFEVWDAGYSSETEVSICKHVSSLTKLQRLCLNPFFGEPAAQDCMQLSGLRSLSHLDLCHMGAGVDDAVAAALVGNMPQLRYLALCQCEVKSVVVLPDCDLHLSE